jgi:trimeric autotransporter adhesin
MKTPIPTLLIIFSLICFAFCPKLQAVSPPPDGGYPNFTTAEGQNALLHLSSGSANTAVGWFSLESVTIGNFNTGVGAATLVLNLGENNTASGAAALFLNTTGSNNTATGTATLLHNSDGSDNTAFGAFALNTNVDGGDNTAVGAAALLNNTASGNTAIGSNALLSNTTGGTLENIQGFDVGPNVAVGWQALESNTVASANTAVGYQALQSFTTGPVGLEHLGACTAVGFQALANTNSTTGGFGNSAFGYQALVNNTDGAGNTAVGLRALFTNTTGTANIAIGSGALGLNTSGSDNTAVGFGALESNDNGNFNVALGESALTQLTTGFGNTAVGFSALQNNPNGVENTAIGDTAGLNITGDGNVCIGAGVSGEVGVDNLTYIRNVNTFTQNFSAGVNDYVTVRLSDGRLGHTAVVSSRRYKEDIKPLATTSEALYLLKPVSFRLKKKYDETQALGFGLIAEEVENVNPDLVYRNNKGEVESVRYEMVNAMLLNEFLKEHRIVREQQKEIEILKTELREQRDLIQKVSEKLEVSTAKPRVAAKDP